MKKILDVAMLKIKLTLKDKAALVWMFLAPLAFVLVIVLGFGGGSNDTSSYKYPIGVVNNDTGNYSKELIDMLKSDTTFEIKEYNYPSAKIDVENSIISMAIVIPNNYSRLIEDNSLKNIDILKLSENETTIALSAVVGNYIRQQQFGIATGNISASMLTSSGINTNGNVIKTKVQKSFMEIIKNPRVGYETVTVKHEEKAGQDSLSSFIIGILIMFLMFFVSSGASSIFQEKEMGTWNRILSTPTKNTNILGGYILGTFLLGWIQISVLIIVSRFAFNVNWGNSILGLILLFSSFLLAIIGLGTALASFVKTSTQLSTLTSLIVMPSSLIAGCMWPGELMPDIMLKISNFVPQTWMLKGLTDLVARGSDISAVYIPSIILLVFTCIFFLVGVTTLNIKKQ